MSVSMFGLVVLTAFLSSVFTVLGLMVMFRFGLSKRLEQYLVTLGDAHEKQLREGLEASAAALVPEFRQELEAGFQQAGQELVPEFRAEVVSGFEQAGQELLPDFRAEVEKGFLAAADEILPRLRHEVTEGVKEGLIGVASVDFVDKTAQSVAKKSSRLFENGFNAIFGRSKRPKE